MMRAISGSSYDSRSITWHQWHHTAPISRSIGLFSACARANAASPHAFQFTGWWRAERKYDEEADWSWLRATAAEDWCSSMGREYTGDRLLCQSPEGYDL